MNIGPAVKVFGKGWDADVHVGFSYLVNKGGVDKYFSHQRDWSFHPRVHFNNYSREDAGKDWFPRWEADLTARIPFETATAIGGMGKGSRITRQTRPESQRR